MTNGKVVPFRRRKGKLLITLDLRDVDQFAEMCCIVQRWIADRGFVEHVERIGVDTYRVHLKYA